MRRDPVLYVLAYLVHVVGKYLPTESMSIAMLMILSYLSMKEEGVELLVKLQVGLRDRKSWKSSNVLFLSAKAESLPSCSSLRVAHERRRGPTEEQDQLLSSV